MKKILPFFVILISLVLSIQSVNALNKLYFTDSAERIYYDTDQFNDDIFMHHTDMIPGSSYEDELTIENGSTTDYTLYFRVVKVEQSEEANELLNSITMKIYIDDNLLYDGYVKGDDYSNIGLNLLNTVRLGVFKPNENHDLRVETQLLPEFENKDIDIESYIDWAFYATYEDKVVEIVPNPNTNDYLKSNIIILGISILIFITIIVILILNKKKAK